MVYTSSKELHLFPLGTTAVTYGKQLWYWGQFYSTAATCPELGKVLSGTHLQYLGVIKDLVLVAALADRKDTLREIAAFV